MCKIAGNSSTCTVQEVQNSIIAAAVVSSTVTTALVFFLLGCAGGWLGHKYKGTTSTQCCSNGSNCEPWTLQSKTDAILQHFIQHYCCGQSVWAILVTLHWTTLWWATIYSVHFPLKSYTVLYPVKCVSPLLLLTGANKPLVITDYSRPAIEGTTAVDGLVTSTRVLLPLKRSRLILNLLHCMRICSHRHLHQKTKKGRLLNWERTLPMVQ